MIETARFARVEIVSLTELRDWLKVNHGSSESVWLVRYKKHVQAKFVDRLDVIDELLCFGWIDGVARTLDDERTMQLISPRKQQAWAETYKVRAARLEIEGQMAEPGRRAIQRSKELGFWNAYASSDALLIPNDLAVALGANLMANDYFRAAAPSYRRNVLRWIAQAKKPATRTRRIELTIAQSAFKRRLPHM